MAELIVPLVSEEARLNRQQQQKEQTQQLLQFAQLRMQQERQQEAQADHEFRSLMTIAGTADFPDDMRLEAINRIAPKLGIQGNVTIDGLRPMTTLLSKMFDAKLKGQDLTIYQPAIEMMTANPRMIAPSQIPGLLELQQEARGQRAGQAVELLLPVPSDVEAAAERVKGRATAIADLRGRVESRIPESPLQPQPALARFEQTKDMEQLQTLEAEQERDDALIATDADMGELRLRARRMLRNNPQLLEQAEKFGLAQAGLLLSDSEMRNARIHILQSQKREDLSERDIRALDSLLRLNGGKGILGHISHNNIRMLQGRIRQREADGRELTASVELDRQAQTAGDPFQTMFNTIMADATQATTPDAVAEVEERTRQMAQGLGQVRLNHVQSVTKEVQALTEEQTALEAQAKALHQQAAGVPSAERTRVLAQAEQMERMASARQAQADLLTRYHPLEILEHDMTLRLNEALADQLTQALQESQPEEVKVRLQEQLASANGLVQSETALLNSLRPARQKAMATIVSTIHGARTQAAVMESQIRDAQQMLDEDDRATLAGRSIFADVGSGLTVTSAVKEAQKLYGQKAAAAGLTLYKDSKTVSEDFALAEAGSLFVSFRPHVKGSDEALAVRVQGLVERQSGIKLTPKQILDAARDPLEASRQQGLAAEQLRQDRPVGPEAGKLARINAQGELERPSPTLSAREASAQGFMDVTGDRSQLNQLPALSALRQRLRTLQSYAAELFTSQPGFFNVMGQARSLFMARIGRSGPPTSIRGPNGQPLTAGELMNAYERERLSIGEAIGRIVNQVKGAGTEPDVERQVNALGSSFDTPNLANQLFQDLDRNIERITGEIVTPVFGGDAASRFVERQRRQIQPGGQPSLQGPRAGAVDPAFVDRQLDALSAQWQQGRIDAQTFLGDVMTILRQAGIPDNEASTLAQDLMREIQASGGIRATP